MVLLSLAVGGSRLQDSSVTWGQEYMGDKLKTLGIHHVVVPHVLGFPTSLLLLSSFQSPVVIVCSMIPSMGLPQWLSGKAPPASAEDPGLIPGPGRPHMPRSS